MPARPHTRERADFYASPAIYDILHTPGTAAEVAALERLGRRLLPPGAWTILEPACGTGRYLRVLAAHGHTAIGFDRDAGMVAYAAARLARLPTARVFQADMETFADTGSLEPDAWASTTTAMDAGPEEAIHFREGRRRSASGRSGAPNPGLRRKASSAPASITRLRQTSTPALLPPCLPHSIDLAFTPINSIRHLDTDRAMLAHFEQIARILKPSGVYAVGLSITEYTLEPPSEDLWQGARGSCRVRQVVQYLPASGGRGSRAREERVISHMTVRTPRLTRHIDSTYTLRAYDLAQWRRLIARSPLDIVAVVDERGNDLDLAPPGYGVFILRPKRLTPARR